MSAEPPPPDRPTGPSPSAAPTGPPSGPPAGPPSGPLSDPSRPGSPSGPTGPPADHPSGPPYGHPDDGAHGTTGGAPAPPPEHGGTRPGTGGGTTDGGAGDGGGKGGGEGGGQGGGGDGPGPGGAPPAEPGGGGGTPWWRSAPRVALLTLGVVAAVVLGVVLTRSGGSGSGDGPSGGGGGEVFLQAADSTGRDPFTESTARDSSPPPNTPSLPGRSESGRSESAPAAQGVSGAAPGLYGGTRKAASCDVEKQIRFLGAEEAKNKAFASALGIAPDKVPGHLRALTPVQLRLDTRVTNHGYVNGSATAYQAVLEAGTAVLVDDRGLPTVRCACGNPLTEPVALRGTPKVVGEPWPGYRASNVVVVKPASRPVDTFVIYDPHSGGWFTRDPGGTGSGDQETTPPTDATPSPDGSPSGEDTSTGSTDEPGTPSDGTGGPSTGSPPAEQPGSPSAGSPPPATEEPPLTSGPGDTQAPPSGPA
ncbi:DUF6777 domain-containing protein [Streptomyces uncialis]|uniref:DUF6777 domain-containing protein n=1 Tax=Streptomyces uncialis TaxID=1048205 RepID=UPI003661A273